MILVLALLMLVLSFKLATLTIAQGDEYRYIADNKRVKEVYTTAPRGEIRDRYGRLLAGNVPSFTVQLLKDELNQYDREETNEAFLKLIRLLEEDGVNYMDEFPIELNTFKYEREKDYIEELLPPLDKVVDIIVDNNLLGEILNSYYINKDYDDHFKFITANKAINILGNKGIDVPIRIEIDGSQLKFTFKEDTNIESWKSKNDIPENASPRQSLIRLIDNDKAIIRQLADDSISSKLIYEILKDKGLRENIILEEYSISYEDEYLNQKRALMKVYPDITMETSAEEDFLTIFKEVSLNGFLEKIIEDEEERIIPGQILIDLLEKEGIDLPLEMVIEDNQGEASVRYNYTGKEDIGDKTTTDILVEIAEKNSLLDKFIISEDIRSYAQAELLNDGVNPRISIAEDIEYMALNNLKDFFKSYQIDEDSNGEEALQALRERYNLDEDLSKYEIRPIFILYYQLRQQGYLAYQPINVAYGIKDSTVAKIEESLMDIQGVYISVEPVRYYPEGTTSAHILGYLGKISQPGEIEKYVKEGEYSPNDIIGKTGIEESFEDNLSGTSGIKKVEVDSSGNTTNVIEEIKPIPGDNLYLTIDLKLQQVAEEALEQTIKEISKGGVYKSPWGDFHFGINRSKGRPYENASSGAVVAIDVKTGQVLASASYPSYDPNLFSTGISSTDWESLFPENENDPVAPRPLLNIATQYSASPGSAYKMVTALTALEKGLSPRETIRDMGYVEIGGRSFPCLLWTMSRRTHGPVNVYDALKDSCNYYFYSLGLGYNQKTGESVGTKLSIEDISDMSKKLGLNDKTGIEINIPNEASGGVPDPMRKILTTKAIANNYLEANIDIYLADGKEFKDEEEREKTIEEIVSWIEFEGDLSRGEIAKRLEELGLEPYQAIDPDKNNNGLADIIKFHYMYEANWSMADTLNVTIGQGQNSYTPIQMANHLATIVNGGYRHELSLIDSIKNYNNSKVLHSHEVKAEKIELNNYENLEHIMEGMRRVSEDGTARQTFLNFPVEVGSKTGTAQVGEYDDFSWFVGFAPYDDPEIAVAAVVLQGGTGGYSGPLVRDVIAEYLGLNEEDAEDNLPYDNEISR